MCPPPRSLALEANGCFMVQAQRATRYIVRRDATGFTVTDNYTGEPLVLAMDPQTGLPEEDAQHLADLFNKRAAQGDRALHQ
jgi:hypothetical protein